MEVYRAALDEVSAAWQVSVEGRVFPAAVVHVILLARNNSHAAALRHFFVADGRFERHLRSRLNNFECKFDPKLHVEVEVTGDDTAVSADAGYAVQYAEDVKQNVGRAWLEVAEGRGMPRSFPLCDQGVVLNVGRLDRVSDAAGRDIRENQIVFDDHGVSRRHGHFTWDPVKRECAFIQDEVLNRTDVLHEGTTYRVSALGDPFLLAVGDSVRIGSGVIRFLAERPAHEHRNVTHTNEAHLTPPPGSLTAEGDGG